MNKLFTELKNNCKTEAQRIAFNELISTFVSASDHRFALDFNKLANELAKVDWGKLDNKIERKLDRLVDELEATFEPAYVDIIVNDLAGAKMENDSFGSHLHQINSIERKTGTEPAVLLEIGERVVDFFRSNRMLK